MLVDANLLLYAVDAQSPHNGAAATWLTAALNGNRRVALAWATIGAFLRIVTHPRVTTNPLTGPQACSHVRSWLDADPVWVPPASQRTVDILEDLVDQVPITGNLVPDAQLAAIAIEHGLTVMTADTDFERFPDLSWTNPLLA